MDKRIWWPLRIGFGFLGIGFGIVVILGFTVLIKSMKVEDLPLLIFIVPMLGGLPICIAVACCKMALKGREGDTIF